MGAPEQTGVYYGCTNLQSEPIRSLCIFNSVSESSWGNETPAPCETYNKYKES